MGGPGVIVVERRRGELDMAENEHAKKALELACARTFETVLVDCSAVEFIDSSMLGLFVNAAKGLNESGCRLQFVHVPASIERVIKIVKS